VPFEIAEKIKKARMLNGSFWRYSNLWLYIYLRTLFHAMDWTNRQWKL